MKRIDTSQKHFLPFKRDHSDKGDFDEIFIASNAVLDAHTTVIPVDNWNLKRYGSNGQVFYQHYGYGDEGWLTGKSPDPDDVIAKGTAWKDGDSIKLGIIWDDVSDNVKAEKIRKKVENGFLNAVSVGFFELTSGRYLTSEGEEVGFKDADYYEFGEVELIEVSVVNLPSNPEALVQETFYQLSLANEKLRQPPHTINLTINGEEIGQRKLNKSLPIRNGKMKDMELEQQQKAYNENQKDKYLKWFYSEFF